MPPTIYEILNKNRSDTAFFSHVSMINPKGKFGFYRDNFSIFMKTYCDVLEDNSIPLGIAEKPESYLPILVDIDLKSEEDKNLYTPNTVKEVIITYQEVLKEIILDISDDMLTCVFLEKPRYKVKNIYKNGFHLHFPNIFLSKEHHINVLIPTIKKRLIKKGVFSSDVINDVVDDCYVKNAWLLYGSKKDESLCPYLISNIYDYNYNSITAEKAFRNYKIYTDGQEIKKTKPIEYYLPYIFSIMLCDREELVCEVNEIQEIVLPKVNNKPRSYKNLSTNMKGDLQLASKLLKVLNTKRVDNHNDWYFIGVTLYNISNGSNEGYELWLEWSRGITKVHKKRGSPGNFNEKACEDEWKKMIRKNLTIGTIKYLAKTDNIREYNKIIRAEMDVYIKKCRDVGGNHYDIAKAMYEKYGHEFKCSNIRLKTWYKFSSPIWKENDEGIDLKRKISTEIVKLIDQKIKELKFEKSQMNQSSIVEEFDDDETENSDNEVDVSQEQANHNNSVKDTQVIDKKIERLYKMIGNCKQNPYKSSIMKECMELFYDPNFQTNLNSNKYLIAFKNGVYDLKQNIFREGIPSDNLSLTLNVCYNEYTYNDDSVKNIIDFFDKVIPDKSVREYFLHTTSEVFVGGNHRKYVYVWQGFGNNGKTVTQNLVEKMLGDYSIKLPTSLLVGKRTASGAACPELARAGDGVRWAVAQEPEKKDVINTGLLKELSGNDSFYARALFKDGRELTPMFKLALICNHLPQIPNSDQATWNRIRIIPFESTFDNDAPEDPEEQLRHKHFPVDRDFEDKKLPGMLEAFAWFLLDYRKKHLNKSLVEPEKVKSATAAYQRSNDIYRQFIEECIVEEENCKISLREMYHHFKEWFKNSVPGQNIPVKNDLKEYFSNNWHEPLPGIKWEGYRIRSGRDDIDEAILSEEPQELDYE